MYFWDYYLAHEILATNSDLWNYPFFQKAVSSTKKRDQNRNGILLPKLYRPAVRKNCSTDGEKLLKFEAEGQEFAKFLRPLERFIQTVKGQKIFMFYFLKPQ